ncbi:MAG: dihydroorotase [Burkholderiaceae bacterium]|nr:dihydroorotase [Burkholderiaceae bacterium]
MTLQTLTLIKPDDWHLHLRDGEALEAVIGDTAKQFARAVIMPNLKPPVTTVALALAYQSRIEQAMAKAGVARGSFTPLMTIYLTDNTSPDEIVRAKETSAAVAVKLYPAGATTNSDAGATDLLGRCSKVLETMQRVGLPLLVHGEVTDPSVDVFDREALFIDRVMIPLRKAFPALRVVFEHLTTKDGVDYVKDAQGPVAATITAQHLLYNRNAIFQGGVRPHWYCLPILKREVHRQALLAAATSDSPRFFLGTDSAPHAKGLKENACGCAGCYTALHAMELYATAFEQAGKLEKLEAFASLRGPDFYELPRNTEMVTLHRGAFLIPSEIPFGKETIVPLAAGETLGWKFGE